MFSSDKAVLCVVSLASLCTCALGHTVYRGYPENGNSASQLRKKEPARVQYNQVQGRRSYRPDYAGTSNQEDEQQQDHYRVKAKAYAQPNPGCENNGDILVNPSDRCSYLECHHGNEPWYDRAQKVQLYTRVRQCPPGTAVSKDAERVLFSPIQYDPTEPEDSDTQTDYGNQRNGYQAGRYHGYVANHYKYKNNYQDMTAICSEVAETLTCQAYYKH